MDSKKDNTATSDDNLNHPERFVVFRDRYDYGPFPALYFTHHWLGERSIKYYGAKISYQLGFASGYLQKGKFKYILGLKTEAENFTKVLVDKIINEPNFVNNTNDKSKKTEKELDIFLDETLNSKKELLVKNLIELHQKWFDSYAEFSFWNIPLWLMVPDLLAEKVKSQLKTSYQVSDEEFLQLVTPDTASYLFEEETELLKIAQYIDFEKQNWLSQPENTRAMLKEHADKWFWIPFDYLGPDIWREPEMLKRLFDIANNKTTASKLLNQKLQYHKDLRNKQNSIEAKYKISEVEKRLLKELRTIANMQDDKKKICTKAQYVLQSVIFKQTAKILNISEPVVLIKFTHDEIWGALKNESAITKDEIEKRKIGCAGILGPRGYEIISGNDAVKLFEIFSQTSTAVSDFRGQIASRGIIRGKVKVLLSPKDIGKMEKGDILVANMTTPDYILAMNKAAAIVTSEGGLTCHAAIVARELKIPCIIGTKI
ncbi:MAG: PEP-utilizing enzyme, partial [Candidatus Paceibacterota bacterium]